MDDTNAHEAICEALTRFNCDRQEALEIMLDIICDGVVWHDQPPHEALGEITALLAKRLYPAPDDDELV